jgi:hypothetical protein
MALPTTYFAFTYWPERRRIVVLGTVDGLGSDDAYTAISILDADGWSAAELDGMVASDLCILDGGVMVIGDRGEVWSSQAGALRKDQLPDAGPSGRRLGAPNEIRVIDGRPYVCGYAGQVYTLREGRWIHVDAGLCEPRAHAGSLNLKSIDGISHRDLYAVGSDGAVFRGDERAWTRVPVLTDVYLHRVRCLAAGWILAVGRLGTYVESDGRRWRAEQIAGWDGSLWDVALYEGAVYVAAGAALFRRRAGGWEPVGVGLASEGRIDFDRLAVGDGRLWAMGSKRLVSFDGRRWRVHVDPDNG